MAVSSRWRYEHLKQNKEKIVMAKKIVAGELYETITGQLFEIGRQLRQPSGYPFDPNILKIHLQNAIEGRFRGSVIDPRYEALEPFFIIVPDDYVYKNKLSMFEEKHGEEFIFYNKNITDENFSNPSVVLEPGRKFLVKPFVVKSSKSVTSEDNLALIESQNGILAGAQGVGLVYELAKDKFLKGKRYLSFDEEGRLWEDAGGRHRVPFIIHNSDGAFEFGLGYFDDDWYGDCCLLCVCDC